jgi:hypothetical protein
MAEKPTAFSELKAEALQRSQEYTPATREDIEEWHAWEPEMAGGGLPAGGVLPEQTTSMDMETPTTSMDMETPTTSMDLPTGWGSVDAETPTEAAPEGRTWGEAFSDFGAAFGSGSNALLKTIGDVYGLATGDVENALSQQGQSGMDYFASKKSDKIKAKEEARAAKIAAASSEVEAAGIAIWETITNTDLLATFVAEQLPMMAPGAGAGTLAAKGASALGAGTKLAAGIGTTTAVGTGGVLHSGDAGSQAYEQLMEIDPALWETNEDYQAMVNDGVDPRIAKHTIATELSRDAAKAAFIISVGVNALFPGAKSLERVLTGAKKAPGSSRLINLGKGVVGESVGEAIEEGPGAKALANYAAQQVDPSQELSEGVGEATGMGAVGQVRAGGRPD